MLVHMSIPKSEGNCDMQGRRNEIREEKHEYENIR